MADQESESLIKEARALRQHADRKCRPYKADASDRIAAELCHSAGYASGNARGRWVAGYQRTHSRTKQAAEAEFSRCASPHRTAQPRSAAR